MLVIPLGDALVILFDAKAQWRNKFTLGPGAEHKTGPPQVQARRQGDGH